MWLIIMVVLVCDQIPLNLGEASFSIPAIGSVSQPPHPQFTIQQWKPLPPCYLPRTPSITTEGTFLCVPSGSQLFLSVIAMVFMGWVLTPLSLFCYRKWSLPGVLSYLQRLLSQHGWCGNSDDISLSWYPLHWGLSSTLQCSLLVCSILNC